MPAVYVVDIGNTRVSWGVFEDADPVVTGSHRYGGVPSRAAAAVLGGVVDRDVSAVGISGVAPDIVDHVLAAASVQLDVPVLRYRVDFDPGIEMGTDRPMETGDDRILNSRAAYYIARGAAITVDAGTAITVDLVTADGVFMGGAILPGIQVSLDALGNRTALLPKLEAASPISAVGSDTKQAMLSGCVLGAAGAVDSLVKAMRREKAVDGCPVYLTGGDTELLNRHLRTAVTTVPHLTLLGLALDLTAAGF
ncbi:MAG: type III pantothenate kinase [Planctomycetes bacterium]|nr:type III pantothenate kinase [Planctomycetota bacterium]